ncbi:DUF805 domain-containing protein [Bosea sp. (in: a-proteobacteria)]|jgi:uncharacterized membrane protein YhaH (DUF805 family)|uniref:DUF805 domain-containing protein n=1 Tax=Bosea sp. (in: a-proteobacteria) TaxID=1871050 RepID=UPI003F730AB8
MTAFLTSFWRFDGRLARLAYALRFAAALAVFLVVLVLAVEIIGLTPVGTSGPWFFVEPVPNAIVMLLFYWVTIALSAQRIRDMGFPVLPIIAALVVLELLENLVLPHLTEARLPEPLEVMTPLGGILSIAALLWLFVWPSAGARPDQLAPQADR